MEVSVPSHFKKNTLAFEAFLISLWLYPLLAREVKINI